MENSWKEGAPYTLLSLAVTPHPCSVFTSSPTGNIGGSCCTKVPSMIDEEGLHLFFQSQVGGTKVNLFSRLSMSRLMSFESGAARDTQGDLSFVLNLYFLSSETVICG